MGQLKNFAALYAKLTPAEIAQRSLTGIEPEEVTPSTPAPAPVATRTEIKVPVPVGSSRQAAAAEVRPRPLMTVELPPLKLSVEQYQPASKVLVPVQVEYPPVKVQGPSFVLRSRRSQELRMQAKAEFHGMKEKFLSLDREIMDRDRSRSVTAPPMTEYTNSEVDPEDFEEVPEGKGKGKGKGKAKEGKKK